MTPSMRHRAAVAAAVIAVLLLAACSSSSGTPQAGSTSNSAPQAGSTVSGTPQTGNDIQTLTYGISGNLAIYWHVYVGQQEGIFTKHHIKLNVVTTQTGSASDLLSLLIAGRVDMANVLPDPVLAAGKNGGGKVSTLNFTAPGVYTLVARKGISSFGELANLSRVKAAVSSATTATAGLSQLMLNAGGIPKSKVALVISGGTTSRLAAVTAGKVDVAVLVQPADFKAQTGGLKVLASSVDSAKWYGLVDTVMTASVKPQCSKYRDFFAAMKDIHAFLTDPANKVKSVQALVSAKISSQPDAEKTYELYIKDDAMPGVNDPTSTMSHTNDMLKSLGSSSMADPSRIVDTSCVS